MKNYHLIKALKWQKLSLKLEKIRKSYYEREIPQVVVDAIVKEIKRGVAENIFFHIKDHTFGTSIEKGENFIVEVIVPNDSKTVINEIEKKAIEYINSPEGGKNYKLIDTYVEDRDLTKLFQETSIDLKSKEVTLEFLTPLHYKTFSEKHRTYIDKDLFLSLIKKRLKTLFDIEIDLSDVIDINIIPYYWYYTEKTHYSKSQIGTKHLINGCCGNLYIRGEISEIMPLLILTSELHIGSKLSFSYGYFKLHTTSIPFLDNFLTDPVKLKKSIQKYLSSNKPKSDKKLYLNLNNYTPTPNIALKEIRDGKEIIKEQMHPLDAFIASYTADILSDYSDRMLENTTFSYRKNLSQLDAINKINEYLEESFEYVLITETQRLYSAVDLEILWEMLDKIIPLADIKFRDILKKVIFNGYELDEIIYPREFGLMTKNPLSALLSNIYLTHIDRMLKKNVSIKFLRYAGNYIFFSKDRETLEQTLYLLNEELKSINIILNPEKTIIKKIVEGFEFLGQNFKKSGVEEENEPKIYKKPLYITETGLFLSINDEALDVKDKDVIKTFPLRRINSIVIEGVTTFSTALIKKAVHFNIPISISLKSGYSSIHIAPHLRDFYNSISEHTNAYNNLEDYEKLKIAKDIVNAKIESYLTLYKHKIKLESKDKIDFLKEIKEKLYRSKTLDEVRGYEGKASKTIFSLLSDYTNADEFKITIRDRFQKDYINTLLNFGYYLLFVRINLLIRSFNLNPYLGFLHYSTDEYEQFVCDIQEIFRARIDKIILNLINLKMIKITDFTDEGKRYLLNSNAKKILLNTMKMR